MPLGDRVLVRPDREEQAEKTKSGIYIPDTVEKEKPAEGVVIAVGDGWYNEDGEIIPLRVKVGDKIIFSKYSYEEVKVDGEEFYILKEENIFAIIK
ncbi:MAG: groS 1 [Candidatus Paceibacter sp.]|nr:groS 1 [Candidatus Paceibacter sp.]